MSTAQRIALLLSYAVLIAVGTGAGSNKGLDVFLVAGDSVSGIACYTFMSLVVGGVAAILVDPIQAFVSRLVGKTLTVELAVWFVNVSIFILVVGGTGYLVGSIAAEMVSHSWMPWLLGVACIVGCFVVSLSNLSSLFWKALIWKGRR